jgi:hypothetical protein
MQTIQSRSANSLDVADCREYRCDRCGVGAYCANTPDGWHVLPVQPAGRYVVWAICDGCATDANSHVCDDAGSDTLDALQSAAEAIAFRVECLLSVRGLRGLREMVVAS